MNLEKSLKNLSEANKKLKMKEKNSNNQDQEENSELKAEVK